MGGKKKRWEDNIRDWTSLDFNSCHRATEDRQRWQKSAAYPELVSEGGEGSKSQIKVAGEGLCL